MLLASSMIFVQLRGIVARAVCHPLSVGAVGRWLAAGTPPSRDEWLQSTCKGLAIT